MQASPYARAVPAILAEMENRREANGNAPPPNPEEEAEKVVYVYPLEGGGVGFTDTPSRKTTSSARPLLLMRRRRRLTRALPPGGSLRIVFVFYSYSVWLSALIASIRDERPPC